MINKIFISSPKNYQLEYWELNNIYNLKLSKVIKTNGEVQPLLYCSEKKILYVGIRPSNSILVFEIKKNNIFKIIQKKNIRYPINYLSFDKKKNILFCASYHGNAFSAFFLEKNGKIGCIMYEKKNIFGCHSIITDNNNKILCVTALKEDKVYLYSFLKFSKNELIINLCKIIKLEKNSGPRHLTFHPFLNIMYIINELNGNIEVWYIYEDCNDIKKVQCISLIPENYKRKPWSSEIKVHPNGRFLYATDRNNHIISLFNINIKNNFKINFCASYDTEIQPRSFCIDKKGKYLIVIGEISNSMTLYLIDLKTGNLKKEIQKNTGKGPLWIITD